MTFRTEHPIFVVGYMHSGTTLVRNILANHPAVYCTPDETKFFMHLPLVRAQLGADDMLEYCRGIVERGVGFRSEDRPTRRATVRASDRELGRQFRVALDTLALEQGRSRWVEKTPTHVFYADVISEAIPDALFVEVVRDPRDVLASKKTRTHNVVVPGRFGADERRRKRLEKSFDPLWDGLSWKSAVRAGGDGAGRRPHRWLRVRYEDLVVDTDHVVRSICSFLSLEFGTALIQVPRGIPADVHDIGSPDRGVATSSQGRWRDVLTATEVALCERTCRREMDMLGYALEQRPVPLSSVAAALATRSAPELVQRTIHRLRLGGAPYLREIASGYARRLRTLVLR